MWNITVTVYASQICWTNEVIGNFLTHNNEKKASVNDKLLKTNYRPISVLNVFSKVFERFLLHQMLPFIENVMLSLLSAYRSKYSTQHVLLRLTEQWRTCLDKDRLVGAILMDISEAFDCLSHDLLIAEAWCIWIRPKIII